ncbi:Calx-beta domain-containing protein [Vibrio fortis]|uniref:Calx-beta domain-containing protein n=1 Tax=Vibrio fortis TaxID=212667 RepID=UPI0040681355
MYKFKANWQSNAAIVLGCTALLSGCQSGHESDGSSTSSSSTISISIPDTLSITEPTSGSSTEGVTVTLSAALTSDVNLTITTSNVTARSTGDFRNYDPLSSSVATIPAGSTTATLPLNVLHNNVFEGAKTLQYSITAPSSSSYTITNNQTTVTINDANSQPTIGFSNSLSTVVEGDSVVQQMVLSNYSSQDVTITLVQTGIAASDDYTVDMASLNVTLSAETLTSDITFSAKDDGFNEGGESVIYTMTEVGNATIDSAKNTLAFYIPGQKNFNDTGYVTYYDGTAFDSTTPPASHPNQDADYGLDKTNGTEHSDGEYGFRYTKIDAHGNPMDPSATSWRCVKDEHTGLYIEAKQAPTTLPNQSDIDTWVENHKNDPDAYPYPYGAESSMWRSSSYTYTWYDADGTTNGGYAGAPNDALYSEGPISSECAYPNDNSGTRNCNTSSYISSLNSYAICGITDWRLPSPVEARSFINFNVGTSPSGSVNFFPNLGDHLFTHSSSVKQDGSARCIDSQTGELELCNKNITGSTGIVAVSGGIE